MGRKWGMEFDEQKLQRLFRFSPPRSKFWKLVREELKRVGRWKNRPRGKFSKGDYQATVRRSGT